MNTTPSKPRARSRRRLRLARRRSGDLGPAVAWSCPCCGGAAEARFGAEGRTVAVCKDERCGFAGLTDHVMTAA